LCTGNDRDATASERAEEFSGYAWSMFHILTDDSNCSQVAFKMHGIHGTVGDFRCKLMVEYLHSFLCILVADTDGRGVLGGGLRNEEHADAVVCQSSEDA